MITWHALQILLRQEGYPDEVILHPEDWRALLTCLAPVRQEEVRRQGFFETGTTRVRRAPRPQSSYRIVDKSASPVDWDALYTERV